MTSLGTIAQDMLLNACELALGPLPCDAAALADVDVRPPKKVAPEEPADDARFHVAEVNEDALEGEDEEQCVLQRVDDDFDGDSTTPPPAPCTSCSDGGDAGSSSLVLLPDFSALRIWTWL